MGIDIKLVTADEAYHDKDGSLFAENGVIVTTPPSGNASCSIPMIRVGFENQHHEYKCGAESGECRHSTSCTRSRYIPVDGGLFQQIPHNTEQIKQAHDIRKNCERPFNLLKNQTGLEDIRVRSQQATIARCTLSSIAELLIKMAGTRRKIKYNKPTQLSLFEQQFAEQ